MGAGKARGRMGRPPARVGILLLSVCFLCGSERIDDENMNTKLLIAISFIAASDETRNVFANV